jgi:TRAP transporter 4TM/12TM fusion protein
LDKPEQKKAEVKKRALQGTGWGEVLIFFAVAMSVFQFSIAGVGGMTPLLLRVVHLAFATTLIFLLFPAHARSPRLRPSLPDGIAIVLIWVAAFYLVFTFDQLASRAGEPTRWDVILGVVTIVLVLEITRRTTGWLLTIIGVAVLVYAYIGPELPGLLAHRGFDVEKIASFMYTTTDGLLGVTLGVSATYIYFFILFGAFLDSMGAGKFFINFAYGIAGRRKGGPAQTVVLANSLMSTISGVPAADVVTIGAFTFPLLNKLGYDRTFTAALSAAASTGAMVTPPVMGSAAFIMSEFTGIPYWEIVVSAAIPSFLFYVSLFAVTHFYASSQNLVGVSRDELPAIKRVFKEGWFYLLPLFVLIYLLIIRGWSPMLSGFYAVWSLLMVVFITILFGGALKENLKQFGINVFNALKSAAIGALPVVATCAVAGLLVGVLNLTGLGLKFSSIMLAWSQGNLFLALVFSAMASMILGMGLPIAACYIILAVLVAPALIKLGLTPMAAHLFILFFGSFSAITPPVAIAAYAAAAMNKVDPIRVGMRSVWLSTTAFIIPFMFAYGPPLLMHGKTYQILLAFVTGTIGVIAIASSLMGWLIGPANVAQRILLFLGALLLIVPGWFTDLLGALLLAVPFFWQRMGKWDEQAACKATGRGL